MILPIDEGSLTNVEKVEVLSVGTELLMVQIANTNAQYISRRMPEVGMGVFYHSVVGDNPQRLEACLKLAMERSDVIITTGGLGPTQDDLTKETVAQALGLKMELHAPSRDRIKAYFESAGRVMVESNFRQAYFPFGSLIMENDEGTAPGCIVVSGEKVVVMLPGPPRELIPMFDRHVLPYFKKLHQDMLHSKFLRVVGIGESLVEQKILSLVNGQTNPTIATYAKDGIVTLRITAHDENGISGKELADRMSRDVVALLGDNVYTTEDEELEHTVFRLLREKGLHFACAESCTGGLLAEKMTSVPGASAVFECAAVTYSNAAKINFLGVDPAVIAQYGPVSKETALAMVQAAAKISKAQAAVSITGYAGPDAGDRPVGTVFIGVKAPGTEYAEEFHFTGNRERIRTLSVINALDLVRKAILKL